MSKTGENFKIGFVRWEQFDFARVASLSIAPSLTEFCQENNVVEIQTFIEVAPKRYLLGYISEEDETVRRERNADISVEVPKVPKPEGSEEEYPDAGPATEELSGV